jgi:hypothetical protein
VPQLSDVFDDLIPARIAAVIASDRRFAYFGNSAFAIRLLRLDKKIVSGMPINLRRVANILDTAATLFQEFCDRFSKYGDKTLTLSRTGRRGAGVFLMPVPQARRSSRQNHFFTVRVQTPVVADLYCVPRPSLLLEFFRCPSRSALRRMVRQSRPFG